MASSAAGAPTPIDPAAPVPLTPTPTVTGDATVGPVNLGTDLTFVAEGDQVQEAFCVVELTKRETRDQKPMLSLRFSNARGQKIPATVFSENIDRWKDVHLGDPVLLTARITKYRDTRQLDILGVQVLPKPHPVMAAMNEVCPPDRYDAALSGFERHLAAIKHPGYRRFLVRFFEYACPEDDFLTCPAALGNHHAYIGGLLEHSIEMTDFAVLGAMQPGARNLADLDLLRAGCIPHDAGKIVEYAWKDQPIGMAPLERLYNHLVTGPIMTWLTFRAHREELEALGFTERHAYHIMHIQASHHGRLAWGSPIVPKTMEAMLAHAADQQSAQMRKMAQAISTHQAADSGLITGTSAFRFGLMAEPVASRVEAPAWPEVTPIRTATTDAQDFASLAVQTVLVGTGAPVVGQAPRCPEPLYSAAVAAYRAHREAVQHPGYRRFLDLVFSEAVSEEAFLECPLEIDGPEAYLGGLVERTAEIATIAVQSASVPGARGVSHLDLVRTGALLHGIGKARAYSWDAEGLAFTEAGQLLPPTVLGPCMLHEVWRQHEEELRELGFHAEDLHHLVHVQVSYHGTLEAGSPSAPATFSAQVVHTSYSMSRQTRQMAAERLALYGQSYTLEALPEATPETPARNRRAPSRAARRPRARGASGNDGKGGGAPEAEAATTGSAARILDALGGPDASAAESILAPTPTLETSAPGPIVAGLADGSAGVPVPAALRTSRRRSSPSS